MFRTSDRRRIGAARLRRGAELYGLVAPAGTPQPIIERLNKEPRAALATDEVKRRLHQEGAEPIDAPGEHAAVIEREESKWSVSVKSIGLKPEMSAMRLSMKHDVPFRARVPRRLSSLVCHSGARSQPRLWRLPRRSAPE